MKKINIITIITTILSLSIVSACSQWKVADEDLGAYAFVASAETVREGNDIPVHLSFSDAGLDVDNPSWGDKWKSVVFYAELYDDHDRAVENAVYSGPGGVLGNGSTLDLSKNGRVDIIIGALRQGRYTLKVNLQTRYTVDTWASTTIEVMEKSEGGGGSGDVDVNLVDDISVPGPGNGLEIDELGNIILDLKYFNETNPFRFNCTVRPDNATNKQLASLTSDAAVADTRIDGQTLLVIVPKVVGKCMMTVLSADGNARKEFGVTVIKSPDDATGFTLPTDDEEKEDYDFDLAGRLELDIEEWSGQYPFDYVCKPIPSTALKPSLTALSDNESVLVASINDGNRLQLVPYAPGYATVTVKTTDGKIVRTLRVVVYANIKIVVDAKEQEPSDEDKEKGIFPCEITMKSDAKWLPKMLQLEVYGKATGRIDLTDPADSFKVDSLKNARTAYLSVQEKVQVLYLKNGNSAYNVYSRLMTKLTSMGAVIHHSADWPNYKDYILYFRLYKVALNIAVHEDFDTNVYRITLDQRYDSPDNRIYQYLF